ncbi:hypothetical protein, partial [Bradyrhizobium sp. 190]|uniref:hypothetical protein n=1 Tax=Bradyrhizobium sp. 190 TaxID=2782658 RepID=UPI001FF8E624
RRLLAIRPLNETLHHFPRRFSKGIIASTGFSHSKGQKATSSMRAVVVQSGRVFHMSAARETDQRVPSSDVEIWCQGKERITTAARD